MPIRWQDRYGSLLMLFGVTLTCIAVVIVIGIIWPPRPPAPDRIELVTMAEDGSFHRVTLVESGGVVFIVVDGRVMLLPTPPAPSEPSTPGVPWLFFSAPVIPGRRRSALCRAFTALYRRALHLPRPRSTL